MTRSAVLVVIGTRPEAIKLIPVIRALKQYAHLDVRVCVTAQHRQMLDQVLAFGGLQPDLDLDIMMPDQSLDSLTARLLISLGAAYDEHPPVRIVVQGDTTTAMIGALAAYYRKIPVAHVEAGLRSGNPHHPWPEEINRKIVATIADLHFAPTETAKRALMNEDVSTERIWVTGNTVVDALLAARDALLLDDTATKAVDQVCARFGDRRVIALTTHRRENFEAMHDIARAIETIARRRDVGIVFPVHQNPRVREAMEERLSGLDNVALMRPLDYPEFVRLLDRCYLVLTDSGGVQEEAPSLGKPVLVMRQTTERPEGVDAGTALLVGAEPERIVAATERLLDDRDAYLRMAKAHNPFGDGRAAERIAEVIANAHR